MPERPAAAILDWDSELFGTRIARAQIKRITASELADLLTWCASKHVGCLYFLADPTCPATAPLLEGQGFIHVDSRVTFVCPVSLDEERDGAARPFTIRRWAKADLGALRRLAATSHTDSRFFFDPHFPREKCKELYQRWIERSCDGWADEVDVAASGDEPIGYVTLHQRSESHGQIGLLAVREDQRGIGVGPALVGAALAWSSGRHLQTLEVVTQGRNVAAQRLYQRAGFRTVAFESWFHKWLV